MCWQFHVLFLLFCFFLFLLLLLLRLRFRRCFSFSASFGPTFWRPWAAFWLHFGTLWTPLESLWAPLGTTWATMLTQGCKWEGSSGALGQLRCPIWGTFWSIFQPRLNNFFENWLPKTIPQPNAFVIWFLSNFSDPRTLIFELSPARERNS